MAGKYVMGIDMGTMGVRSLVFDLQGTEMASTYYETPTRYPRPGWMEQEGDDVVSLAYQTTRETLQKSGVKPEDIAAVSFTNMRSTFVPVDKDDNFLDHIYLWTDLRGTEMFPYMRQQLEKHGWSEMDLYNRTGFPIGAVWPSSKVLWYRKHKPELFEKTYKLAMPQEVLIRAYGGEDYYGTRDDAGWWQIVNADTFEYDPEVAGIFELDLEKFPPNFPAGTPIGKVTRTVAEKTGLAEGTLLVVGSGDQQCGAIGVGNAWDGMANVTLGTAGLAIAYSSKPVRHPKGANHVLGHPAGQWQMEGHASAAASSFRWFRDTFGHLEKASSSILNKDTYELLTEPAKDSPPGAKGAIYLPWLAGAACPYYDENARAAFVGMTFAHTKGDMVRAALEGICFEMRDMLEALQEADFPEFQEYRIGGGAARSDLWNQIQADVYGKPVQKTHVEEGTALGAAMCAAVGAGVYKDIHEAVENMVHLAGRWEPIPENVKVYDEMFRLYRETYQALKQEVFPGVCAIQEQVQS